jgi:hypothetical protein
MRNGRRLTPIISCLPHPPVISLAEISPPG